VLLASTCSSEVVTARRTASGPTIPKSIAYLGSTRFPKVFTASAQRLTTQARRGPVGVRQSGRPLAATNVQTAGSVCKRHDAVHLGRKKGLQPRASERPAVACSG